MDHLQTAFVLGWGLSCLRRVSGIFRVRVIGSRPSLALGMGGGLQGLENDGDVQLPWPLDTWLRVLVHPLDSRGSLYTSRLCSS